MVTVAGVNDMQLITKPLLAELAPQGCAADRSDTGAGSRHASRMLPSVVPVRSHVSCRTWRTIRAQDRAVGCHDRTLAFHSDRQASARWTTPTTATRRYSPSIRSMTR